MTLTNRRSRNRTTRWLGFEQVEKRQLMAADIAAMQPAPVVSNDAQLMIELVNRARSNPSAEAQRLGIDLNQGLAAGAIADSPKQPLTPNQHLVDAAMAHTEDMLANDYFSHTGLDGSSPSTRVRAEGYSAGAAENIALNPVSGRDLATVLTSSHEMLFRSAGHRQNLMSGFMSDIGLGNAVGDQTYSNGRVYPTMLTTQKFGRESSSSATLTGVAYTDSIVDDDFYTPGEGMANLMIEAVSTTGARFTTHTGTSGGYSLELPAGRYTVRAYDGSSKSIAIFNNIEVGGTNVKLDWLPEHFVPTTAIDAPPVISIPDTPSSTDSRNYDVNGDGNVSPLDALRIINHLNKAEIQFDSRLDVNKDAMISPIDALIVINRLNAATLNPANIIDSENHREQPADPRLLQLIDQVTKRVQEQFPSDRDLVVESAKPVTWSDSGLDLGRFGASDIATPGYQIVLRYGTILFEYRASTNGPIQVAGWKYIADFMDTEDGFCCPWDIDAPCLEAMDKALDAVTVDYIHSSRI